MNENRYNHIGIRSVASRPDVPTYAGGEILKSQKTDKTVLVTTKNNIDTLNYETPRNRSREGEVYVHGEEEDSFFMDESPLQEKELFKLADMRLKEIFNQYAKNYSSTGGKALTFEKINHGYENLSQPGFQKILKDYNIVGDKVKVQFLFKRLSTDGSLATYQEFQDMIAVLLG